jgi:serine/threonine-protein kinase
MQARVYNTFELSPDQQRLAIQVIGAQDQIYVYDRSRETFTRSTLQSGNFFPVWTKDGKRLIFCSNREGPYRMYWKLVDRGGGAERLMTEAQAQKTGGQIHCPESVSPDGKFLLFMPHGHPQRWTDIWVLPLEGEREPRPLVATEVNEILASFSPDGRWIIFGSDKTGRYEIFVRPFPEVDRREWQVSNGGGDAPRWSPLGDELFYRDGDRLMSVSFSAEPDFTPGSPHLVLEAEFHNSAGRGIEVSADGQRFLVNKPVMSGESAPPIHMVTNWFDELKRLAPTGND